MSAYRDKLEEEDLETSYDFHKHIGREVEQVVRGRVSTWCSNAFKDDRIWREEEVREGGEREGEHGIAVGWDDWESLRQK